MSFRDRLTGAWTALRGDLDPHVRRRTIRLTWLEVGDRISLVRTDSDLHPEALAARLETAAMKLRTEAAERRQRLHTANRQHHRRAPTNGSPK